MGNGKWDGNGKAEAFPLSPERTAIPRRSLAFVPRALGENTVFGPSYPGDYAFEEIAAEQGCNSQRDSLTRAECLLAMGCVGEQQPAPGPGGGREDDRVPDAQLPVRGKLQRVEHDGPGGLGHVERILPGQYRLTVRGGIPAGLAGEHAEQLAKRLRWKNGALRRHPAEQAQCGGPVLVPVHALGVGQPVGVDRDPGHGRSYSASRDQGPMVLTGWASSRRNRAACASCRAAPSALAGTIRAAGLPCEVTT